MRFMCCLMLWNLLANDPLIRNCAQSGTSSAYGDAHGDILALVLYWMLHGYPQWWHVYYAVCTDLVHFQKRHNADITYCSFGAIASLRLLSPSLSLTLARRSFCIQTKCVCFDFWMRLKINFNSNKSQNGYAIATHQHCFIALSKQLI